MAAADRSSVNGGASTVTRLDTPLVWRVPWYEPKNRKRSRTTGPPSVNPNWF
jgi:hypothetical protein